MTRKRIWGGILLYYTYSSSSQELQNGIGNFLSPPHVMFEPPPVMEGTALRDGVGRCAFRVGVKTRLRVPGGGELSEAWGF